MTDFCMPEAAKALNPFECALLMHYGFACAASEDGTCKDSTRDLAALCQMSVGMVSKARQSLAEKGFLELTPGRGDRAMSVSLCEQYRSYGELVHMANSNDVHAVNESVHEGEPRAHVYERAALKAFLKALKPLTDQISFKDLKQKHAAPKNGADASDKPAKSTPPKVIERSDIFKRIAFGSFEIKDVAALDKNAVIRINQLVKWLRENSPGATEKTIAEFYVWYEKKYSSAAKPRSVDKFAEHFNAFKQQHLQSPTGARSVAAAPMVPPPIRRTPEELARLRAQVETAKVSA